MEFNLLYGIFKNNTIQELKININIFFRKYDNKINQLISKRKKFKYDELISDLNNIKDDSTKLGFEKLSRIINRLISYIKKYKYKNDYFIWDYIDNELDTIYIIYESTYKNVYNNI